MTTRIQGVVTPVITPCTPKGGPDLDSFRSLLADQIRAGVDAVFVLGGAGEGPLVPRADRSCIIAAAVEAVAGRALVVVGVSEPGTLSVIDNIREAEAAGCDAVAVTSSFYADNGQAEVREHFRRIRENARGTVIAYDIPSKVHVKIQASTAVALAREGTIDGLKDSSGDMDCFRETAMGVVDLPNFSLLTGSDTVVDAAYRLGAQGMVVGGANVDPDGYCALRDALVRGDDQASREVQERLFRLAAIRGVGATRIGAYSSFISGIKAAAASRGLIACADPWPPSLPLDAAERTAVDAILQRELSPQLASSLPH